jgi:DNA-binding transcriptional regulator YdaS (Cro superfamily)
MKTDVVEPVLSEVVRAIDLCGGPAAAARALAVSSQLAYFWRAGKRRMGTEHGAAIEQATGGRVTRQQLWPASWQRMWPELAAYEAAAPLPVSSPDQAQEVGHA